jgi:DNA processing protein
MTTQTQTISDVGRQCLRLQMTEGVGPIIFGRLIEYFGTPKAILEARPTDLRATRGIGAAKAEAICRSRGAADPEGEIERAAAAGVRIICRLDPEYPEPLLNIADPPICLYVQGRLERFDAVAVAVVGSRRCTHYGHEQGRRFGYLLAQAGFTVVSGMARGIDSCAHMGAIEAEGRTLAVLGNGLAHTYPPESEPLRASVVEHGAVLSELPMDAHAEEGTFPARNRIIAGLSLGTLIVEAGYRSGALITAGLATDYNREVFAVPGRVDVDTSAGTNALIRDGKAKLVTGLDDILEELGEVGRTLGEERPAEQPLLDANEERVFKVIDVNEWQIDDIIHEAGLTTAQVNSALTMLQLKGLIKRLPGNRYVRAARPVRK